MSGAFKPGDVVVLKSGGPKITVVHGEIHRGGAIRKDDTQYTHYRCEWLKDDGELQSHTFPEDAIRLFDEDEDDPGPQVVC